MLERMEKVQFFSFDTIQDSILFRGEMKNNNKVFVL